MFFPSVRTNKPGSAELWLPARRFGPVEVEGMFIGVDYVEIFLARTQEI
jgi:hypothetical protein